MTSASTVGFPLESRISLALTSIIFEQQSTYYGFLKNSPAYTAFGPNSSSILNN